jgi:outer membrane protein assembly factor BamB
MGHRTKPPLAWRRLWLPVVALGALAALSLVAAWSVDLPQRQQRVMLTLVIVGATSLLLMLWIPIWILALSRATPRERMVGLAGYTLLLAAAAGSFVPAGWSGDVVPIFRWRWARAAGELPLDTPRASAGDRALASRHDWPGFLGPRRDGVVRGVELVRDWARPPRELWRRPVGAGWSGFAVAGDYAVTQEQRGEFELVAAYDLASGTPLWSHAERSRFEDAIGGAGPRATPSIEAGRVFALGATGRLVALELASGRLLWSRRVLEETGATAPIYGVAASPLVVDGRFVVVSAGGAAGRSLVAYDPATGDELWSGGDAPAAYSSPMLVELAGVRQILLLGGQGLVAHDPATGQVLWRHDWPPVEKASQPVALPPDRFFVSTGYGVGGKLFALEPRAAGGLEPRVVWESLALKAKFTNVVAHAGQLYGLDDGILACIDQESGSRRWKGGRYGHGQLLLAGQLLVVLGEDGRVTLVEASPLAHVELGSYVALEGKTWNHPALAGSRLLVRNDREAACFELPAS